MDLQMRKQPRKLALVGTVTLVAFGLAAYGAMASSSGSQPNSRHAGNPLLIGVVSAQSGFMSPFDVPARAGVQRAIDDLNKSGGLLGRPLKMIFWNSKSDTTEAARGATNLLRQGAKFLFASCDFDYGGPCGNRCAGAKHALILVYRVAEIRAARDRQRRVHDRDPHE